MIDDKDIEKKKYKIEEINPGEYSLDWIKHSDIKNELENIQE